MAGKYPIDDTVVNFPLESNDEVTPEYDESPPPYQHPQIDFSSGWKDRGFAIVFWIHAIAVIIVGLVLGIPILIPYVQRYNTLNKQERVSFDSTISLFIYSLSGATITGVIVSFTVFFLLQQCARRIILCSLILIVIIQILICALFIYMKAWGGLITFIIILLVTIGYICSIRKRIVFAEVHLRVGCAILRSRPSLIFVALCMIAVQILWFLFWCLMVIGILHASNRPLIDRFLNPRTTDPNLATKYNTSDTKLALINKLQYRINNTNYRTTGELRQYNRKADPSTETERLYRRFVTTIIVFLLLIPWYWGSITLINIVHFITACTVGQWWFPADTGQQYVMGTSIKRALTTNFGTICFGSLLEALIKALRSSVDNKKRKGIGSCVAVCILKLLENLIGYINEWAFTFVALTGQSFIQASKSFIDLFRKRGWTMIINDSIISNCLMIVNIVVGIVSAVVGGLLAYFLIRNSLNLMTQTIIVIAIISFLIGIFLSAIMITMLNSCVHTIFLCFALNPAALGATHPKHLQKLTRVWHEFYPNEYAASGYENSFSKSASEDVV